jgi:multiple sugar transport system substrate-binding protein
MSAIRVGRRAFIKTAPRRSNLATLNGASIYIVAKRQKDKIKDDRAEPMYLDIDHAPLPAGPAGGFLLFLNMSDAIMKYSKSQNLAKDLLRWIHQKENYERWFLT